MDDRIKLLTQDYSNQLLNLVPEFKELALAKQELESDPVSMQLWKDKEEQRQTIELLKKQGLPVSSEQELALAQKLKEMRENKITMRYLKSLNMAIKISGKISADLEEIVGVDFASRRGCK